MPAGAASFEEMVERQLQTGLQPAAISSANRYYDTLEPNAESSDPPRCPAGDDPGGHTAPLPTMNRPSSASATARRSRQRHAPLESLPLPYMEGQRRCQWPRPLLARLRPISSSSNATPAPPKGNRHGPLLPLPSASCRLLRSVRHLLERRLCLSRRKRNCSNSRPFCRFCNAYIPPPECPCPLHTVSVQ